MLVRHRRHGRGLSHPQSPAACRFGLAWILSNHGGARALFYDELLYAPIVQAIAPQLKHVEFFVALGDEIAPIKMKKQPLAYEKLIASKRQVRMGGAE